MGQSPSLAARLTSQLPMSAFHHLRKAESILFHALTQEDDVEVDCSPAFPKLSEIDTRSGENWTFDQTIRGGFLRWVCIQIFASPESLTPNISIRGAHFTETPVDLSNFHDPLALTFKSCRFEEPIDLSESHFLSLHLDESWAPSLGAKGIVVDKELSMNCFSSPGLISLERARIGGDVDCTGAIFGELRPVCNPEEHDDCNVILNGQNMQVAGGIYLACTSWGAVKLTGAQIGADLDCGTGHLNGLGNSSLILEKVLVQGEIFFAKGFESAGDIWLNNAIVKNGIYASGGLVKLTPSSTSEQERIALRVENSQIGGTSYFASDFSAEGASFKNSELGALQLFGAVGGAGLNLQNTRVREFNDNKGNWIEKKRGHLKIDGFIYERILDQHSPDAIVVQDRLRWLQLEMSRSPQPYMQLAQVLKNQGDYDGATEVLQKMEEKLVNDSPLLTRMEGKALAPFGYGYSPQSALWLLLGLTGIGWIVYRRSFLAGNITPTEAGAYDEFKSRKAAPPHYPKFSALVYSLENTFPLVDLGQASKWQPDPTPSLRDQGERVNEAGSSANEAAGRGVAARSQTAGLLRVFLWLQILLGWLLATLFVAGVSGFIRR